MDKLKEKYNFDLKKNYIYYTIYSNALLLNKKLYLLYDFWNKRKEFVWLKSDKKEARSIINYQGFFSLDFLIYKNVIEFDYFTKWSSSYLKLDDLIIKKYLDSKNKNKFLAEFKYSINNLVSDDIFFNYVINNKSNFFYFFKNKFFFNFFFKLSKRDLLKFKYNCYIYVYDSFYSLNKNYYTFINCYNWKNNFNYIFYNKIKIFLRFFIIKNIKIFIFSYFEKKIKNKSKNKFFFFKKKEFVFNLVLRIIKKNYFRNWIIGNNEKKKNLLYLKLFFQYKHFYKKFNKRFNRIKRYMPFNKRFSKYNNYKNDKKLKKERFWWILQQSLLPVIGNNIYKNFKKKIFFSFLKKKKNKKIFFRNFYSLNSLAFKLNYKHRKISKNCFIKKKKKRMEFRILKKLKTFYYIPDIKKTRQQVFSRFKRNVLYRFKKKNIRRSNSIYGGLKFNLSIYNIRNRYKNKMKMFSLKKKTTPRFFFFKRKKNNYINNRNNIVNASYKTLPYFLIKKYKFKIKKEKRNFKRKEYRFLKCFDYIKNKEFNKYIRAWRFLFRNRGRKFRRHSFNQYIKLLKDSWSSYSVKKKVTDKYEFKKYTRILNIELKKRKKSLWFFQKIMLYWKNLLKLKKNKNIYNFSYINKFFYSVKSIYVKFFNVIIKFIKLSRFYNYIRIKKKKYLFFTNIIYLLKFFFIMFLYFVKKFNKIWKKKTLIYKRVKAASMFIKRKKYAILKRKRLAFFAFLKKKRRYYFLKKIKRRRYFFYKYKKRRYYFFKRNNKTYFIFKNKNKNKNETRKNLL